MLLVIGVIVAGCVVARHRRGILPAALLLTALSFVRPGHVLQGWLLVAAVVVVLFGVRRRRLRGYRRAQELAAALEVTRMRLQAELTAQALHRLFPGIDQAPYDGSVQGWQVEQRDLVAVHGPPPG